MSDIQEEQKRLYKRVEENDIKVKLPKKWLKWEDIMKENKKVINNEKNELQSRIDKAIKYITKKGLYSDYGDRAEDDENALLNILKGDNK